MAKDDSNHKGASVTLTLRADSGYTATESARISAEQWERILRIAYEAEGES